MTNTTEIEPGRINVQNSPSSATNYYTQPLLFVDTLKDCMEDEYCHIYYHHVMKTGKYYKFQTKNDTCNVAGILDGLGFANDQS